MRVPFKLPHVLAISIGVALPLSAQWLDVKTKHVPLTKDGKPNLNAPAPKLPDGKPNLSGVWNSAKAPCEETFTGKAFGCIDSPDGIPIGFIDVTATSSEEVERGAKDGLPYQPAAAAFVKQRKSGND